MIPSRVSLYQALDPMAKGNLTMEDFNALSDRLWSKHLAEICRYLYKYE